MSAYTIGDARYYANKLMRYLSRALFVMEPVPKENLGTFAVDKYWRMYYDPELLEQWTLDELSGVILHECFHLVLAHADRREFLIPNATDADCYRWNIAADLAINSVLSDNQIKLPANGLFPGIGPYADLPRGLSTEEYYGLLSKMPPPPPGGPGLGPGGSSGTDGQDREWEDDPPDESESLSPAEQKRVRRGTVQEMREQISRGNEGNELEVIIGKLLEPKVDPVQELFVAVKYAVNCINGFGNTTFRKPNRRYQDSEFVMPSHIQPVPEVRVLIDSSGSMNTEVDLPLAAGIIARVVRALPSDGVKVYCADTDIRSCEKVFRTDTLKVVGRGGTRMEVAIPKIDEEVPTPNVIIVVTDGETGWPERQTKAKCIVCLTRSSPYGDHIPSWIKTMEVFDD